MMMMIFWGFRRHLDWFVEGNVSEKHPVSIFRAEKETEHVSQNVRFYRPDHTALHLEEHNQS
jgi:hypothetical protein